LSAVEDGDGDGSKNLKRVLEVSKMDVKQCYSLAKRVGNQWAKVLQRQGYTEFADIVLDIVGRGHFLDPSVESSTAATNNANNDERASSKYVSPYTALHALRRYPPDCDGSGLPLQTIPLPESDKEMNGSGNGSKGEMSSARKVIQQIDKMAHNGETNWHHGWDAIEEASKRNKERIDYFRVNNAGDKERYEIVPKQDYTSELSNNKNDEKEENDDLDSVREVNADFLEEATAGEEGGDTRERSFKKQKKNVHFKDSKSGLPLPEESVDEDSRAADIDFLLSTNKKSSYFVKQKRRKQEQLSAVDEPGNDELHSSNETNKVTERGRPASSIGETTFSWEELCQSMAMEERKKLIMSAIHPPYPLESEMNEEEDEEGDEETKDVPHTAILCGALKEFGQTHLWEQTRHLPETNDIQNQHTNSLGAETPMNIIQGGEVIYGASEAHSTLQTQQIRRRQKRALFQATKERLGYRTKHKHAHRAEYAKIAKFSKVQWTQGEISKKGCDGNRKNSTGAGSEDLSCEPPSEESKSNWLEMDLGECMLEVTNDDFQQSQSGGEECKKVEGQPPTKRFMAFRSLELALRD